MDSDRFTRPVACVYCGGIFNHYSDCPNKEVEDGTILEYRPISSKRMKMLHVETYHNLVDVLTELTGKEYFHWDEYGNCYCNYCKTHWRDGLEVHTFECPVKRGRDILRNL